MSAYTVAALAHARSRAVAQVDCTEYRDALRKAPRAVVVGHLLQASAHLLRLAVRAAIRRAPR